MDDNEPISIIARSSIFFGLLLIFILLENLFPRRKNGITDKRLSLTRQISNLTLGAVNVVTLRVLGPVTAIGAAVLAYEHGWGLLQGLDMPFLFNLLLTILIMDFAIYLQHVATHFVPALWRLHKVHHSDQIIDTSTALRFHTLEILLSMIYKFMIVFLLGPLALCVLIYEIMLNGAAMFNHSNFKLPLWLDKFLRLFIVTPDMHRVHHSQKPSETNSNFGNILPIWDRLFGTYQSQPEKGHLDMEIGLTEYDSEDTGTFLWTITLPFKAQKT